MDNDFCEWIRMEIAINRWHFTLAQVERTTYSRLSSSATNISTIYERVLSKRWTTEGAGEGISCTAILDTFFLHALLLDSQRRESPLVLPHHLQSSDRLMARMHERNSEMVIHGLHHWTHRCDICIKVVEDQATGEKCEYRIQFIRKRP